MNEARPYASLSSGLLARKGTAKPAMRPQGYNGNLEDLGWNDMGGAPGEQPAPPVPPEHVPSSIAALTPAPKIQRTNPTDAHLPPDGEYGDAYEDEEGHEAEDHEPEVAYQADQPVHEELPPVDAGEPEFAPAFEQPEEYAPHFETDQAEEHALSFESEQPEEFAAGQPAEFEAEEPVAEAAAEPFEAPSVVAQQRAILERFDGIEELAAAPPADVKAEIVPLPKRGGGAAGKPKAAFTLRLDAERHLRLRLACAVTRHSAQQIVARALDEALASIPEIEALASQVPAKPGRAGKSN